MGLIPIVLLLSLAPVRAEDPEANRAAIAKAVTLMEKSEANWRKVLYVRRREVKELDTSGKVTSQESLTTRREAFEDLVITRTIARNDQPLSAEERQRQEESVRVQIVNHRERLRQADPAEPGASRANKPGEDVEMMRAFVPAMEFRRNGTETVEGRAATRYAFTPKPGYDAPSLKLKVLEKVRGTLWIDEASGELVRADAEVFEQVNIGLGILGRVAKGTRFTMHRREAAPGIWLPSAQSARFAARVMMVKSLHKEVDVRWSEFQLRPSAEKTVADGSR